nr:retrovirus-related Pol polyprotein from transposon TNT 1-94 [Tanacetum cinerariifolium]
VSIIGGYLANLGKNHWEAVKWILKYLKAIVDVGLVYGRDQGKHVDVDSFVDADYAKDPDKGRSIIGYVFMVHGCVVSWKATLQHVVALSTTEAEYMVLTEVVKESIWLQGLLIELGINLRSVVVSCDNQGVIHLLKNEMFHERTKHINVRYHFIREIVESKEIEMAKIGTKDNTSDTFTKAAQDPFSKTMTDAEKTTALKMDVYKKAHSALLMCLDNKVLREVNKEDSTAEKLFTFYMHSGKKLSEHIDEFNKFIGDLVNIDIDIDDEDQALMLLTSLPSLYDNFMETLLYGR